MHLYARSLRLCLLPLLGLALAVQAAETPAPADTPAAAPTPPTPPAQERSVTQQQALARQLPAEQQKQLRAGDETFLALLRPASTAKARGTLIILPSDGESADWPDVVGPVRNEMPRYGWQTLSLSLPDPFDPLAAIAIAPAATAADSDAQATEGTRTPPVTGGSGTAPAAEGQGAAGSGEPAQAATAPTNPDAAATAHAERMAARLAAGIDLALQLGAEPIVLVGHGTGAYWAARYLAEKEPGNLHALVLIDGREAHDLPPRLLASMGTQGLRIADLVHANDRAAAQRKERAQQKANKDYRQYPLPRIPGDRAAEQEQTVRRLRGWLDPSPGTAASGNPAGA